MTGWTPPEELYDQWKKKKKKVAKAELNSKSLNAIFIVVFQEKFRQFSNVEITKEAWTILETTYEGTLSIKNSKLSNVYL